MYLYPVVSLHVSSFELVFSPVNIYYTLFRSCRTNLVSRSHLTFSQQFIEISLTNSVYILNHLTCTHHYRLLVEDRFSTVLL